MPDKLEQAEEIFSIATPVGQIAVHISNARVVQLDYAAPKRHAQARLSPAAARIKQQIQTYFKSPSVDFDFPVQADGTQFQKRVWRALQNIPVGTTMTYGDIAKRLHTSARAVGNACRSNPVPLIIPCHRVIASQGIGGFAGKTTGASIDRKRWLLRHEGVLTP